MDDVFVLFAQQSPPYCDDLKLICSSNPELIQNDLDQLSSWSICNYLQFHPLKNKVLPFGFNKNFDFMFDSHALTNAENVKDLGLWISSDVSWNQHINNKLAKCTKRLNFLRRNIPLNVSALRKKLMFQSIVLSVLIYGSCVSSPSVSKIRQLEAFQFRAIKWIYKHTTMFHHSIQWICSRFATVLSRWTLFISGNSATTGLIWFIILFWTISLSHALLMAVLSSRRTEKLNLMPTTSYVSLAL